MKTFYIPTNDLESANSKIILSEIVDNFFSVNNLNEARERLWLWFASTISGSFKSLDRMEKNDIIDFYRLLEHFLDDAYKALPHEN